MSNNSLKRKYHRHHKLVPWFLLLVFAGPWVTAQVIYTLRDQFTFKTLETGKLLSPPIQIQSLSFFDPSWLGKWQMVYVNPINCDASCQTSIPTLKQIHAALGKEKHKVEYHSITTNTTKDITVLTPGDIAIIDPRGWLMMHYPPNADPQGILKDIHRLLRHSHGG